MSSVLRLVDGAVVWEGDCPTDGRVSSPTQRYRVVAKDGDLHIAISGSKVPANLTDAEMVLILKEMMADVCPALVDAHLELDES